MTEAELKAIEARAADAQLMPGAWSGYANTDRKALLAEVRRLRGLVKAAEMVACRCGMIPEAPGCPWCAADSQWGESRFIAHDPDCPAFTPDGSVR
jgi:hypothetical protein